MQLVLDFGTPAWRPRRVVTGNPRERLEARMAAALSRPVRLTLTENRRTMISGRRRGSVLEVRLHRMFLDAPEHIVEELLCYLAEGDARSSRALSSFIDENRHLLKGPRRILLRTRGRHHDLAEIFASVVAEHFPEGVGDVRITWGRNPPRKRRRRSIRLGTYTHELELVRIHPALDQREVPRFFVEFVVFHELLHHVIPARRRGSRIDYHPPEFRARERAHPDYERALRWETENIDVLLRG